MKKFKIDWPYLRQGMIPVLCGMALTVTLLGASMMLKSRAADSLEMNRAQLSDFEQQGNEMRGKVDAMRQYRTAFTELESTGVVGVEDRLVWVQFFRDGANGLQLPYMRYTADQQRIFSASWLHAGNSSLVMASKLKLQMGLIHSLDLLRIFDHLRGAPGFFHVSACELERVVKDGSIYANKPNILASCDIDWFTIPAGRRSST